MVPLRRVLLFAAGYGLLSLATASPAHAYIDPGTGSYFFQMLIAGLLGAGAAIAMFWRRIVSFFSRSRDESDERPSAAGEQTRAD